MTPEGSTHVETFTGTTSSVFARPPGKLAAAAVIRQTYSAVVAFARYSRDRGDVVLRQHARVVVVLALGSIAGTVVGGLLLGGVPEAVLVPGLAMLLPSSIKVWRHSRAE